MCGSFESEVFGVIALRVGWVVAHVKSKMRNHTWRCCGTCSVLLLQRSFWICFEYVAKQIQLQLYSIYIILWVYDVSNYLLGYVCTKVDTGQDLSWLYKDKIIEFARSVLICFDGWSKFNLLYSSWMKSGGWNKPWDRWGVKTWLHMHHIRKFPMVHWNNIT